MPTTVLLCRRLSPLAVIFTFLVGACSDSIAPPKAATIEASSPVDEEAFAGAYVPFEPQVLVRDENGAPVAGVTVTFVVTSGGGTVENSTTISGPQGWGWATAGRWTLGSAPGTNTLVATVAGVGSVVFRAEGVQVPTGRFELMKINGQPLPFGDDEWSLTAETITLNSNATFTRSLDVTYSGKESSWEMSGTFSPHAPGGLSFYDVRSNPWADGKIEGDTLTLGIKSSDLNESIVSYVYVRAEPFP